MRFYEFTTESLDMSPTQHYLRSVHACLPYAKAGDWDNTRLKFHAYQAYSYWFNVPAEDKQSSEFKEAERWLKDIVSHVDLPRHNEKRRGQAQRGEIEIDPSAALAEEKAKK